MDSQVQLSGIRVLLSHESDHSPIMLDCFLHNEKIAWPFWYYDAWSDDPECKEVVELTWNHIDIDVKEAVERRSANVRIDLRKWQVVRWEATTGEIVDL